MLYTKYMDLLKGMDWTNRPQPPVHGPFWMIGSRIEMDADAKSGREMWAAIMAAEDGLAKMRAEFYHHAPDRLEIVRDALRGSMRERITALSFLQRLGDDVPELTEVLADLALSDSSALGARRALQANPQPAVRERVAQWAMEQLPDADDIDFRMVAEVLAALRMWPVLRELVRQAEAHHDAEIREAGRHIVELYPMVETRWTATGTAEARP